MSTEQKKKTPTHTEKVANAMKSVETAISNKVKAEGNTPEQVFGNRIGDGVKKAWTKGDVPGEQDVKNDAISLGTAKELTASSIISKCIKFMTFARRLSLIETEKAKLKKANKDITPEQLASQLGPLVKKIDEGIKGSVPTESTSK